MPVVPYKLNYFEIETGIDAASTFVHSGDLTAAKLIIDLGTSNDVLLGDGTTFPLSSIASLTAFSAVSPLLYNNTTGVFSIQVANASQNGYLSSTDWTTFNSKQGAITLTTTGTSGAATFVANTLNIPNYADTDTGITTLNTLTALTQTFAVGSAGTDFAINSATSTHTFNLPTASAINRGALSSADWSTFNSKQDTITLTTTGTSGAATLIANTLNIPQYTDAFVGTVTSVSALTLGTTGTDLSSTVANSTTTPVITLNVPTASAANRGALSAADWTTFDSKQIAGNYITSLTGEATASGPGASAITLTNSAVIAKVLTGLNVTGGTVIAADTILAAFGKVQNQINGLIGGSIFQGTWNASTNTPALVSSVGTNGHYYIVSVAGSTNLDGITDWKIGDWAIFAGTSWQKVDNTDAVSSVNGFTGAVSLTTDNISEGATNLYFTNTRARTAISLTTTGSSGASTYDNTTGVFNIPTYTDAYVGTVTSVGLSSATSGVTIGSTPVTTSGTITIAIATATSLLNGLLSSTDWTTFNNKQGTITLTTTGTSGAATFSANTLNIPQYQASGTYVTSVTGTSPIVSSGGTTPAISIPVATTSVNGYLSSTDWTTFNSKQATITLTTTGTSGAATFSSNTLNIPNYADSFVGTVTSVAAITLGTTGSDLSSTVANGTTTPVITLQVPTASAANRGALSSADWSTFNGKQGTITLTTTGTSGAATFSANTLNIPNYADGGVLSLSAIGGTANANAATITGTVLNLQPADASFGGVVTTGTQTFAGAKTLTGALSGTSATFSGTNANIQLGATAAIATSDNIRHIFAGIGAFIGQDANGEANIGNNIYYSTGFKRRVTGFASNVRFDSGNIYLQVAASAAADSAITWTNALTIASTGAATFSGNVILGNVADDGNKLQVNGSAFIKSGNSLYIGNNTNANYWGIQSAGTGATALTFQYNSGASLLSIASTGAATFSGLITLNSTASQHLILNNTHANGGYEEFDQSGTAFGYIGNSKSFITSGTLNDFAIRAQNNFVISAGGGTAALTIASTGAATFASLVNASGIIRATSASADTTGSGAEIAFSGGIGYFLAYNRGTSAYLPVGINGSTVTISTGASATVALTIASTGAATFSSSITTAAPSGGTAKPFKVGTVSATGPAIVNKVMVEIDSVVYYIPLSAAVV